MHHCEGVSHSKAARLHVQVPASLISWCIAPFFPVQVTSYYRQHTLTFLFGGFRDIIDTKNENTNTKRRSPRNVRRGPVVIVPITIIPPIIVLSSSSSSWWLCCNNRSTHLYQYFQLLCGGIPLFSIGGLDLIIHSYSAFI